MIIRKAKTSSYDSVSSDSLYYYIRQYVNQIYKEVEPAEDQTGNDYKNKRDKFEQCNRTQLKLIAAELETITKRLDYILYGRY